MRRHEPVIAHCTDSEDLSTLVSAVNYTSLKLCFFIKRETIHLINFAKKNGHKYVV